jgi:hypothetical protein
MDPDFAMFLANYDPNYEHGEEIDPDYADFLANNGLNNQFFDGEVIDAAKPVIQDQESASNEVSYA